MRILVVASNYPHPGHPFSGAFNEKCVAALKEICKEVVVLAPRPYVPPLLSFVSRWKSYSSIKPYEVRDGVSVHRPAVPVIPRVGSAFSVDLAAFLSGRRVAKTEHRRAQFDAIVSFDLIGTGGVAWRLARDLGIPASGWAFGNDVRLPRSSTFTRVVIRALQHLDVVFYQSRELLEKAAELLGTSPDRMSCTRHVVLAHGIPEPPELPLTKTRNLMRAELGVADNQVLILNTGRVSREKGLFELIDAISLAAGQNPLIVGILVGSNPGYDESALVQKRLKQANLSDRIKVLPACSPTEVWEYLCAADIFAFPSHNEGMPNSLLEAMAMGVPAIAFGIPPVLEINAGTGALITVPAFDCKLFAEAILRLSASPDERCRIGERGKAQVFDRFMVRKNMAAALERLNLFKKLEIGM